MKTAVRLSGDPRVAARFGNGVEVDFPIGGVVGAAENRQQHPGIGGHKSLRVVFPEEMAVEFPLPGPFMNLAAGAVRRGGRLGEADGVSGRVAVLP